MSLIPNVQLKMDELFLRWFSFQEVQSVIREDLECIKQGRYEKRQDDFSACSNRLLNNEQTPPCSPRSVYSPNAGGSGPNERWMKVSHSHTSDENTKQPKMKDFREISAVEPYSKQRTNGKKQNQKLRQPQRRQRLPNFYFSCGKPISSNELECQLNRIAQVFSRFENHEISKEHFGIVAKACQIPFYCKVPLFDAAACGAKTDFISSQIFLQFWRRILNTCHDLPSKFVNILSKGTRRHLLTDDFIPFLQDIIENHPGLTFLKAAEEFHSRYIQTVIARIFYCVNRSWSGQISIPELRKSNLLQIISLLEREDNINQITDYFSYEHFYVIYCKFWELDKDHDLLIDRNDLGRHSDNAISSRMINRIFSGAVLRDRYRDLDDKLTYSEFVYFLLSEEDKRHPTSIEYWFRCMDLDGDGFLSMYELEYFYDEQMQRMDILAIEALPFQDCLCQMLDMIAPKVSNKISLADLKRSKMAPVFFDTFFNLEKYLNREQKDPFATQKELEGNAGNEQSDWNRFAYQEYQLLVEEDGAEDPEEMIIDEYVKADELVGNLGFLLLDDESDLKSNFQIQPTYTDDEDYLYCAESDNY